MKKIFLFIFSILICNGVIAQSQIALKKSDKAVKEGASISKINLNKFRIGINISKILYKKKYSLLANLLKSQ